MAALWWPPKVGSQGSAELSQPFRGYGVLQAHPCVVKNTFLTFLHVVGEDPAESFHVPTNPRRPMSAPPKLRDEESDTLWHAEGLRTDQDWRQQEKRTTRRAGNEDHDELCDMHLRGMSGSCVHGDNCTSSTCGSTCTGSRQYSSVSDDPSSTYSGTCAGLQQYSSGGDDCFWSNRQCWQGLDETWQRPPPSSTYDVQSCTSTLDVPCDDIEKETDSVSESTSEPASGCQDGGTLASTHLVQVVGHDCRRRSCTDPMPWDDVVTVMVRRIPRHFLQLMFLKEINDRGFGGLFDFFHVPSDLKKGMNVGYGFINFIEAKHAHDFRREFDGLLLDKQAKTKGKPLCVHPANVQGYEANCQQFMQTHTGQKHDPRCSPLFLRPGGSLNPNSEWGHLAPIKDASPTSTKAAVCATGAIGPWCADAAAAAWYRGDGSTGLVSADAAAGAGNRPNACYACGDPHGAKHNFCSTCGTQVTNQVVLAPAPNFGFHGDIESSAKLFRDLEIEQNRLVKEMVEAQSEDRCRAVGEAMHLQQQQKQTHHYAAIDTVCKAACARRPTMLRGSPLP